MFCFGGIGATPDDYTRNLSAKVFSSNQMKFNEEFKNLIDSKFPNEDNTKKYNLAYWPINSSPIRNNPINGFFGFEIEKRLIEIIGDTGKKLHTARSRNDQVAVDFRRWTLKRNKEIVKESTVKGLNYTDLNEGEMEIAC